MTKQITVVKMNSKVSCQPIEKKRHCRRRKHVHFFVEEICGTIFQKCDSGSQVYFRAIKVRPPASVKIQNDTHCEMEAIIKMRKKEITQKIGQSQQVSLVLPSISTLTIKCCGEESQVCRGRYTIKFRCSHKIR